MNFIQIDHTNLEIISWKNHRPRKDEATPRTALEIICVMGEVTLIDNRPAMLIRNPIAPYRIRNEIQQR
jgi:hypothetical protein